MKKIISALAALSILFTGISVQAVRGYRSLWIECENSFTTISGDYKSAGDSNASGGASLKLDSTKEETHEVGINFTLSYDNEYDIYIMGTPGTSDWASNHKWKIDDGEYAADSGETVCSAYKTGDSRGAGLVWHKLTTAQMDRGMHTIYFKTTEMRSLGNDFYYDVLDVIAIAPSSWEWKPSNTQLHPFDKNAIEINNAGGSVEQSSASSGDNIKVSVSNRISKRTDANLMIYAELCYNGEPVSRVEKFADTPISSWAPGREYNDEFELSIPFNAPQGEYDVVTGIKDVSYSDGSESVKIGTISVGDDAETTVEQAKAEIDLVNFPKELKKGERFRGELETVLVKQNCNTSVQNFSGKLRIY